MPSTTFCESHRFTCFTSKRLVKANKIEFLPAKFVRLAFVQVKPFSARYHKPSRNKNPLLAAGFGYEVKMTNQSYKE